MTHSMKATARDIVMEQGRLHLHIDVASESHTLPTEGKLRLSTDAPEIPLTLKEGSSSSYEIQHDAGVKVPGIEHEALLQVVVAGESLPVESKEAFQRCFLDGNRLIRFAAKENGEIYYSVEPLTAQKPSPYSVVRLEQLEVQDNRLHIAGRFAPLGMVIQEWGQASYVLVLQSADRVYSFGLGIHDRPEDDLPLTLRKSYFSDIKERGIDLGRVQDGFYTLSVVAANNDISVGSGILGSIEIRSPQDKKSPRISLLGSCIIRDVFNSRFVPDWKNRSQLVSEAFQQSIVSAVSDPYTGPSLDLSDLDTLARRYTEADLQKSFMRDTLAQKPEWVLIDLFSDARFAAIETGEDQFITDNSWKIANSASYKNLSGMKRYKFSENPEEYLSLFRKSLQKLKATLPAETKFAYVQTDAAPYSRDDLGGVDEKAKPAEDINAAFRVLEKALMEEISECKVLDLRKYAQWGDKEHAWSSYVVHYEQRFYDALDEQLRRLTNKERKLRIVTRY